MSVCLLAKMLHILVLCPVLLIGGVQTLTIDSQLGTSIEDCFERVSIGEQLPSNAIYRNVSELTTRECEQICKQDKQCQAYDYGVGAKGNATCDLSTTAEKEVREKSFLTRHPDYDVYVRRFNCEQSPPSPIQTLSDELTDGPSSHDRPQHRPVFRPDMDERPLADDYLITADIDPYNSASKPISPYKPEGPSYGEHKPQDISYPERPRPDPYRPTYPYRPNDLYGNRPSLYGPLSDPYPLDRPDPYMPDRPDPYRPNRPDPYQPDDPYKPTDPYRPSDAYKPNQDRPHDPYRPQSHPYKPKPEPNDVLHFDAHRPEKPDLDYIRPNRKPRPQENFNNPLNDPYRPNGPIGPPYRPDIPTYSYNTQYASNYGQNTQNDVQVEIYNPPRPYVPIKDRPSQNHDQGFLGYGTYSSQNAYTESQNSYTGTITEIGHQNGLNGKPHYGQNDDIGHSAQKGSNQSYGQNSSNNGNRPLNDNQSGYQRPNDRYKPINQNYGGNQNYYGGNHHNGDQYNSYGSSSHGSSYDSFDSQSYGETSYQKPSYNKPSYNGDKGDYGNQGYGNHGMHSQGHWNSYGSQNAHGFYGSQGYGNHGYGSNSGYVSGSGNRPVFDYETHRPGYSNQKPPYASQKPGYGSDRPDYDSRPSYGIQKPEFDKPKPGYGNNRPDPGYGNFRPDNGYDNERPDSGYDSSKPDSSYNKPSYGNDRPYPGYGSSKPDTSYNKPSYGNDRPDPGYGSSKPDTSYNKPSYGNDRPDPGYGSSKPDTSYNKPSYGNDRPDLGYGSSKPDSSYSKPSYSNGRPDPGYGGSEHDNGYNKPSYNYERPDPGYGSSKPDTSYNKPSYGNDRPDPVYSSSRPDSGYDKPTYGNDKLDLKPGFGNQKPENTGYGSQSNSSQNYRPDVRPVYEYEMDKPTNVPTYIAKPGGEVVTSRPVVIGDYERPGYKDQSYEACFRRVLAGRRALRSFVRRVAPCEQLDDCRRECATEKAFHCESFNYKLDPSFRGKGLCELMTKPIEAFDQRRDFVDDKNYDFYEIDRNSLEPNCPETLRGPGSLHSGFLSSKPGYQKPDRVDSFDRWSNRLDQRPDRFDQRPNLLDQRPYRVDQSGWRDRHDWMGRDRFSFDDRRHYGGNRFEEHYVPYQIGQMRTENTNWGQYGGNYGGGIGFYKDRNEYHKSIDHWGLNSYRPDKKGHDFDYHSLGKNLDIGLTQNDFHGIHTDHKSSYGYGLWKRGQWNTSSQHTLVEYPQGRDEDVSHVSHEHSHVPSEHGHSDHGDNVNECYSHRKPGMSLSRGSVRRSLIADNVVECESACFGESEFKCVSYSYRYSTSRGTDNCFLSETPYRGLEMSSDSSSDVYGMPQEKCVSSRPFVESECFWHVRSSAAVSGGAARATLAVGGLGACEAECVRASRFYCRGFSFRFGPPSTGEDDTHNCILTSSPATTLEKTDAAGYELYARGNYGRGCEPAVYDELNSECYLQYDKAAKLTGLAIRGQARVEDEQTCGTVCTEAPFRCLSFSFNNNAALSTDNCLLSDIRLFDLQRGVDYVHAADNWLFAFDLFNSRCWRKVHTEEHSPEVPHPIHSSGDDIYSHFHPPSGPSGYTGPSGPSEHSGPPGSGPPGPDSPPELPYIPDSGPPSGPSGPTGPYNPIERGPSGSDKPYPIQPHRPRPDPEIYGPVFHPPDTNNPNFKPPEVIIPYKPAYPDPEPSYRPERPSYRPEPPSYRPESPSYISEPPIFAPEAERPFRPAAYPKPDSGFRPVFRPEVKPGVSRPGYLPGPQKPGYPVDREDGPIESSWRHYTVSGFPCRAGTTCAQNKIVGHWACEPEGGEIGSWDYCCAPTHRCGYSEGFNKPWCFVGQKEDQWRPCSERYYPYHHHNRPHPSQGNRDLPRPRPWSDTPQSPWPVKASPTPPVYIPHWDKPPGPYLSQSDRQYWDDLYENGPKAYYDKNGNPLPGYSKVPTESRPYIRFKHNNRPDGPSGQWVPVSDPPTAPGLGAPRYWPVAYLHRGPPPNMTYYRYNETRNTDRHEQYDHTTPKPHPNEDTVQSRSNDDDDGQTIDDYGSHDRSYDQRNHGHSRNDQDYDRINDDRPNNEGRHSYDSRKNDGNSRESTSRNNADRNANRSRDDSDSKDNSDFARRNQDNHEDRDHSPDNKDNKSKGDQEPPKDNKKIDDRKPDIFKTNDKTPKTTTTEIPVDKLNNSDVETIKPEDFKAKDSLKGIDDKLDDFSKSIEVLDIEDAKGDKISDLKTLEAEELQIEAIGRLLASRRGGNIVLEKRSQKELGTKHIAVDEDTTDFNFGNRFNTERRGTVKRISKDEIERDKSLELSETTYVRPPRVLSTTENIRKAIVNGKVFYDATVREPKDLNRTFVTNIVGNNTRKSKNLRRHDNTTPSIINNSNYGRKKIVRTRNVNPVRRVKRVYKKRYNPEEVRRRLLERDRGKNSTESRNL